MITFGFFQNKLRRASKRPNPYSVCFCFRSGVCFDKEKLTFLRSQTVKRLKICVFVIPSGMRCSPYTEFVEVGLCVVDDLVYLYRVYLAKSTYTVMTSQNKISVYRVCLANSKCTCFVTQCIPSSTTMSSGKTNSG